jgi:hypothetical protein
LLQLSCSVAKKDVDSKKESLLLFLFCSRRKRRRTLNPKTLNLLPHPQYFFCLWFNSLELTFNNN